MIRLQPATEAGIPVLRTLAGAIWRTCYPGILSPEQIEYMLDLMYDAEVIRHEMAAGVEWHLALLENEPVGFVACAHEAAAGRLKLNKIYLLPSHHGKGLGRQMLDWVKARAAKLGARQIHLTVNKRNAKAIEAYHRAGFQIVDAMATDIGGGFVMDDYVMNCPVTER